MKKVFALSVVLASVLLVAGCFVTISPLTYTVSGGIDTFSSVNMYTPATLSLTQGSTVFSVSITMPAMDGNHNQLGTYSISGVPVGTYTMQLVYEDYWNNVTAAYSVNSGINTTANMTNTYVGSGPYYYTVTIGSLSIGADETVDLIFQ